MTCLLCKDVRPWTEDIFIHGLLSEWLELPDGATYEDCDECWAAIQRVSSYDDGEVLIRDENWNWRKIKQ